MAMKYWGLNSGGEAFLKRKNKIAISCSIDGG